MPRPKKQRADNREERPEDVTSGQYLDEYLGGNPGLLREEWAVLPITDALLRAMESIPEGRRDELLRLVQTFAENAKHQPSDPLPRNREEMERLGIEIYPDFVRRTGKTDGKQCLKENWRRWLKKFTASLDRNYMSLADLGRLDPQLLTRLRKQCSSDELHKLIPSLPALNQERVNNMTAEEKRDIQTKNTLINRKLYSK